MLCKRDSFIPANGLFKRETIKGTKQFGRELLPHEIEQKKIRVSKDLEEIREGREKKKGWKGKN